MAIGEAHTGEAVVRRVLVRYPDGNIEKVRSFTRARQADAYFEELCETRSAAAAAVLGLNGESLKKYFRIDQALPDGNKRSLLDLRWTKRSKPLNRL